MKKQFLLMIEIFFSVTFIYSQKVSDVMTNTYKYYEPNGTELSQTKNGLTIDIVPLHEALCSKYPELFAWDLKAMPSEWSINLSAFYPVSGDGKRYAYPFSTGDKSLNVYKIKITNNTGHIIKMSDARIYMRVEGEDPIKPVKKMGNAKLVDLTPPNTSIFKLRTLIPQSVIDNDQDCLVYWLTWMWQEWDKNRKKGILSLEYPIGFPSQVLVQNKRAFKLINDLDVEILPDDSYSGILLFPRLIIDNDVNIKLYEFSTKTDAAGNVTEKSNFDFKLKLAENTMYYDRNTTTWLQGNPPQKVEYFDKKQKKWFYGVPEKK